MVTTIVKRIIPGGLIVALLAGLASVAAAAEVVRRFLREHPDYNPKLRAKILQAADNLFRAEKLIEKKKPG